MEGYVYLAIVLVVGVVFAVQSYNSKKVAKEHIKAVINKNYGNRFDREYSYEELKKITTYYKYLLECDNNRETIDDITWNDLDMDDIYKLINHSYSSVGDEYLYSMLRLPKNREELIEFNRIVDVLYNNEELSKELEEDFVSLGRQKRISLFEFIHKLGDLGKRSNIIHYVQIVLFCISIVLLLTIPTIGIFAIITIVAYNVVSYYKQKNVIESYFSCFKYLVHIVSASKEVQSALTDEFKEYKDTIKRVSDDLKSLEKGLFLISDGVNGSIVEIIMDYVRMIFHLDLIKFNNMIDTAISNMDSFDELFECLGKVEAALSVASFRKYLVGNYGSYCTPEIIEDSKKYFGCEKVYHPLIENPVVNSIKEDKGVLLTGSNASGKSTFLKTIAINVILSRTIYTATADKLVCSPFEVYSSMALRDDLSSNESYYIVEIKSLKRIIDAAKSGKPMICFVDEVLRGTNTVERIAASSEILKSFNGGNVICFAATHDIELTHILDKYYSNYHFEESIENDDVKFNYKLNEGRATTRNAIKLLKVIGYDDSIIRSAQGLADNFMETGKW